jgi:hypothetical protein
MNAIGTMPAARTAVVTIEFTPERAGNSTSIIGGNRQVINCGPEVISAISAGQPWFSHFM